VIPMDGFHYDDSVLESRGQSSRKGSPPTFDVDGFRHLIWRLKRRTDAEVAVPIFDRTLEVSRAAACIVPAAIRYLIVEGNYLLLQEGRWNDLVSDFDLTVMLDEPRELLERRLIYRWLSLGYNEEEARAKMSINDMPNVELVLACSHQPDVF
jgi:pantothenate kinase